MKDNIKEIKELLKTDKFVLGTKESIKSAKKGTIKKIEGKKLFINILALCVFPIIARPLIEPIIFNNNNEAYKNYIKNRKDEIMQIVLNMIRK